MPSAKDWRTHKSPGIEKQTELEIEGEKFERMIHFQRFGKRGQLQGIPENAGIPGLVTNLMLCLFFTTRINVKKVWYFFSNTSKESCLVTSVVQTLSRDQHHLMTVSL